MNLTIPTPHGDVTVEAKPTETGGLVTNPVLLFDDPATQRVIADLDWRTVTHTPSGMRFPVIFPDDQHAADFAKSIGHLADWQQAKPNIPEAEVLKVAFQHGGIPEDIYYLDAYQPERTAAAEVRKAGE
ncbi:hypothetical protein [Streptomyces malaysiensis]|uniref:Uncharacterized protein n=1 Tax=Streptomyces malaysiensis subsp. samsunensis TaxID=459658 RepID=A0A9X2LY90_STRMQ|nr:hypothetical protein [Streptomyces samsunensis]MCQ8831847.1 hypothetical protein [Streptomyces samsunensis]